MKIDINIINKIAVDAGAIIMEIYNNIAEDLIIDRKADDSPLTIADSAANAHICQELAIHYPDIPIISEENKLMDYKIRKKWNRAWLVDPLDGTKEFIKRNGEFTVNIALIENGKTVLGVVYVPASQELYYSSKGEGAFLINKESQKNQLRVADYSTKDRNLIFVASRSHMNQETKNYMANFIQPEIESKGSSLKFMLIAKGEAHIYPRIAPTMEWDTGAAQAILEEAGGKVIRYDTGKQLSYNKENLLNPFFIAMGNMV